MKFKFIILGLYILIVSIFFKDVFLKNLLPIPSDTIVGLYSPYREFYSDKYPRGIPFKNFLITDPVRQQYPWKKLVIDVEKKIELPLWNPYSFSGTPLLANFQSAAFYPVNILFFLLPFNLSWTLVIVIQPLLAGLFMFLYLNKQKLDKRASILGSLTFAFCGFSMSWLEWGNILNTFLWLPLILFSIDNFLKKDNKLSQNFQWILVASVSLLMSYLAGHLQIFFYLFIVSNLYFLYKIIDSKDFKKGFVGWCLGILGFIIISLPITLPTLQFINLSARSIDQSNWNAAGWFIPLQNLAQFLVPDFFGNPTTLNYFGEWNYGEFIGYAGLVSLIFAIYSLTKPNKNKLFFIMLLALSALFAFPNFFAELPYKLSIPFLSTSQPTRLIAVIDFCIAVLSAFGFNMFLTSSKSKKILLINGGLLIIFAGFWLYTFSNGFGLSNLDNLLVTRRNLIFPSIILIAITFCLIFYSFFTFKNKKIAQILVITLILINLIDLFRLGWKYNTFSKEEYLYPTTKTISFLKKNLGNHRFMQTNSEILPPNFSIMYKLQSIDGYDPLFVQRYVELVAAIGRGSANIHPPFGFNRIINLQKHDTPFVDLLGVKYALSFDDLTDGKYVKVFQEGKLKIYQNNNVFDRAFFVQRTSSAQTKQEEIDLMYSDYSLKNRAIVATSSKDFNKTWSNGKSEITNYSENKVIIKTSNEGEGFLILTDTYYPTWHVKIDGKESKIYLTDFNFRGVIIPKGEHEVVFYDTLF
jgi:hypothetical protein